MLRPFLLRDRGVVICLSLLISCTSAREKREESLQDFVDGVSVALDQGTFPQKAYLLNELNGNMKENGIYDVLSESANWQDGHSTFFVGARREDIPRSDFLNRITNHLKMARDALSGRCVDGYLVLVTSDYEAAFAKWKSKDTMEKCLKADFSQAALTDAKNIMNTVIWVPDAHNIPNNYLELLNKGLSER